MTRKKPTDYTELIDEGVMFDLTLLDGASASSNLETPITEYPEISTMIDFLANKTKWETENLMDFPLTKFDLKKFAKNGVIKQDLMEQYLKNEHLPSSGIKTVLRNPASFFFYLNDRKIIYEAPKPHFELGSFSHSAFLEPKLFKKVKAAPKVILSTTEGCKTLANFYLQLNRKKKQTFDGLKIQEIRAVLEKEQEACKYQIIQEDHKLIIDIVSRNHDNYAGGIIPMIMKGASVETSFYGTDKQTGLKVKVRPDAINIEENIGVNAIISLKTTSATSVDKFASDTARHMYELSEGMYQEVVSDVTGRKFNVTIMIMLQTVAPFLPAVFWWSPEDLQNGKYKYRYALNLAKECLEKQKFPGFESHAESGNFGIINLKQPQWAAKVLDPIELEE